MAGLKMYFKRINSTQWILFGLGLVLSAVSGFWGISDNIPAIITLMVGLACLAGALVWNLSSARKFWILFVSALLAFPVGAILHNIFYMLEILVDGIRILEVLMSMLGAFFFLISIVVALPVAIVGLLGGIITGWRGLQGLTLKNRSCRRFHQKHQIKDKVLYKLLNLVKQSASGANLQPLKFILSNEMEKNEKIFPALSWAGYLPDWEGPADGERPSAYIIVLGDTGLAKSFQYDAGIASQSITLGAAEMGLGACLIGSIKREALRKVLEIPDQYEILLVIALGKPAESFLLEKVGEDGDVKYWRDEKGIHHIPKRGLEEIILEL